LSQNADLTFDGVSANDAQGAADGIHRAMVIVAAELCGAARGALAIGADYASERIQFGRPIGSFQGVAHQLAEAYAGLEGAWSLTIYAAWALDYAHTDAAKHVYLAKSRAAEAAVFAAERVLQVHGGMGMTWEATPHLFLRRALSRSAWLGGAAWHRRAAGAAVLRNLAQD
jgi:alkylation response protein AidB-like acyl-CoA dehydrogenase